MALPAGAAGGRPGRCGGQGSLLRLPGVPAGLLERWQTGAWPGAERGEKPVRSVGVRSRDGRAGQLETLPAGRRRRSGRCGAGLQHRATGAEHAVLDGAGIA
ncbi:hypothetical protein D3C76_715640 [compost metagenome]